MKNKAHVWMCGLLSATMAFTSCTNFLEEDPKTFLSPSEYYTTENQIKAAVDGTYDGLDDLVINILLRRPWDLHRIQVYRRFRLQRDIPE